MNLQPRTNAPIREKEYVAMCRRDEDMLREVLFSGLDTGQPFASASLGAISMGGQTLHVPVVRDCDHHILFGDQVLLDESPRTASAIAQEACHAIGFFRPDLLELIERNPRLGLKIVMRLSQMITVRLRQTNRLLKEAREIARKAGEDAGRARRAVEVIERGDEGAKTDEEIAAAESEVSSSALPAGGASTGDSATVQGSSAT